MRERLLLGLWISSISLVATVGCTTASKLSVVSDPPALSVYLDGKDTGARTPTSLTFRLPMFHARESHSVALVTSAKTKEVLIGIETTSGSSWSISAGPVGSRIMHIPFLPLPFIPYLLVEASFVYVWENVFLRGTSIRPQKARGFVRWPDRAGAYAVLDDGVYTYNTREGLELRFDFGGTRSDTNK